MWGVGLLRILQSLTWNFTKLQVSLNRCVAPYWNLKNKQTLGYRVYLSETNTKVKLEIECQHKIAARPRHVAVKTPDSSASTEREDPPSINASHALNVPEARALVLAPCLSSSRQVNCRMLLLLWVSRVREEGGKRESLNEKTYVTCLML